MKRSTTITALALGASLSLVLVGPLRSQATKPAAAGKAWDAFVTSFLDGYFKANPDLAVQAGRHEFDGRLPDWSAEGLHAQVRALHAARDAAGGFTALDERQGFERSYLVSRIDRDLFWLETMDLPFRSPYFYADSLDPDPYVSREYAPLAERLRAYTAYAKNVPKAVEQIRRNVRTPIPKAWINISRRTLGGLADFYADDVPKVFAAVQDAALQSAFRAANGDAITAMKGLDTWLATQEATGTDAFALGPEKFRALLLATEGVDTPLDELERIARKDLDRNLATLKETCAVFAPGATLHACMERAAAHKPAGEPVAAARAQLAELRAFVADNKLLTIPGTELALVGPAPAYKAWNFAYINIPGPFEKGLSSTYYIAPPDPTWPKEKQDAYLPGRASLLFTSVHEVWPGHFLQYLHANRSPYQLGRLFIGYAYAEGWAHYAEEMMWDAGLGKGDPEIHIGQLENALLRNVRFVSAIGLHTKGMTVAESERLFLEQGYQDAGNAEQQAQRGTFDPAYGNYTMGKLMITRLREDWTRTRGGRKAWAEFHDKFLSYGGPPIPLVREAMLGTKGGPLF
jgi:Bacterial protein of unknown function (DUF885)